jgi:hypothetical protein
LSLRCGRLLLRTPLDRTSKLSMGRDDGPPSPMDTANISTPMPTASTPMARQRVSMRSALILKRARDISPFVKKE